MRPVPVVFLLLAFSDQLSAEQNVRYRGGSWGGGGRGRRRTLPGLGGGVSTAGAGVLLDVERAATTTAAQGVRFVL